MCPPSPRRPKTPEEIKSAVERRLQTIRRWKLSLSDFESLVAENPHVYAPMSGFLAEYQCRERHLKRPEITKLARPSGYDKNEKGDFTFIYKEQLVRLEVKSLDGPRVEQQGAECWTGTFQCNASDKRSVLLPNGHKVETNCIVAGGWDVLAVNLFSFGDKWRFAFARQCDLPRASELYKAADRKHLLASSMRINWPLTKPFTNDLVSLLDTIVAEKKRAK